MHEDQELLRRYVENRSDDAFRRLVRRHLNLVYFSALRRMNGDAHLAQDIAQLVFIALAREAKSLQSHTVLTGWLYVATRHAAAQAIRTEQRRKNREQEATAMHEFSSHSSSPPPDWEQIHPELEAALDDLDERDRDAVLLRYFQNRPFAEIAGMLRISSDAARMRVDRALDKLRISLTRRGITSTTAALALALEHQSALAAPATIGASVNHALITSGAISSAGGAGAQFHFMSSTTLTLGIAGAVSLVALGTAFRQSSRARESAAALAVMNTASAQRVRDLQAKIDTFQESGATSEQAFREGTRSAAAMTASADETPRKKKKAPSARSFSERLSDPEYASAWRQRTSRDMDRLYHDTFATFGLDPERLAILKTLLVEREVAKLEAIDVAGGAGMGSAEADKAAISAQQPLNDKIRGLIGQEDLARFEREERAVRIKPLLENMFVPDLNAAGVPLTSEQMTEVGIGMRDYYDDARKANGAAFAGIPLDDPQNVNPQTGLNPHAEALLDRLAPLVTPAQLQVIRNYFVDQTKWNRLSRR
jgi:RNA polymerase sigma factor (sigma-70 family)